MDESPIADADAAAFCRALHEGVALEGSALQSYAEQVTDALSFLVAKAVAGVLLAMPNSFTHTTLQNAGGYFQSCWQVSLI
ncbi:MAG: hypothetical protein R3273_06575 [Pseudidiomarina maritima]|nr:hypothetical protein [Pseudidiomarina maritima]